jgi:hypothetical protein
MELSRDQQKVDGMAVRWDGRRVDWWVRLGGKWGLWWVRKMAVNLEYQTALLLVAYLVHQMDTVWASRMAVQMVVAMARQKAQRWVVARTELMMALLTGHQLAIQTADLKATRVLQMAVRLVAQMAARMDDRSLHLK